MNWFLGAILLLVVALALGLGLMAYAMYALLGVMIASRMLTKVWAESVSAKRECNRFEAEIGETIAVVIKLENRGALPIPWLLVEDLLPREAVAVQPPRLGVIGRRLQLAMLWGRGQKTLFYQLKCAGRGYFQIGPLVLETGDVFGLHRRFRVLTEPHYILVYPKLIPLEGYDLASRRPIGEVRMTHRLYEDPTRIAGVRQYQTGDPLNRIHWRATARTGVLHSKIYEPSSVAGATFLLDFHQASYDPSHEPVRSELAITTVASLANAVYLMGQQVGLVTNGRDAADRIRFEGWAADARTRGDAQRSAAMLDKSPRLRPVVVETEHGPEKLMQIRETLARLELTDGLSFAQLVLEATSRLPHDATIVAVLSQVTMETALALGNLRRRGYAVSAIVNTYHLHDFEKSAGMLLGEGIDARHLAEESAVATVCRQQVSR